MKIAMPGRSHLIRLSGGLLLLAMAAAAQMPQFGPQDYSAVMVIHLKGGATQRMAVAKRGMMWRSKLAIPGHSGGMIQLINLTTRTMYMIMPQMCMKHALPNLPPGGALAQAQEHHPKVADLGPATVTTGDGKTYACEHSRVTYNIQGKIHTIEVYAAKDLKNFPVKLTMQQNGHKVTVTYEDIKLTPPAASLFAPPAHCGGMPGMPGFPH